MASQLFAECSWHAPRRIWVNLLVVIVVHQHVEIDAATQYPLVIAEPWYLVAYKKQGLRCRAWADWPPQGLGNVLNQNRASQNVPMIFPVIPMISPMIFPIRSRFGLSRYVSSSIVASPVSEQSSKIAFVYATYRRA